jgi:hypothetical protein
MKLERTITTTTTPQIVKTVQTVTGKVGQVRPPNSVTLTLENGSHEEFKIPEGQKLTVEGKETDAFGLRKGMLVSATNIIEVPENVITQQRAAGRMPPPTEAIQGLLLIVVATAPPAEVAQAKPPEAQRQPKKLSQTAGKPAFDRTDRCVAALLWRGFALVCFAGTLVLSSEDMGQRFRGGKIDRLSGKGSQRKSGARADSAVLSRTSCP